MKPLARMLVIACLYAVIGYDVAAQTTVANQQVISVPIASGVNRGALLSLPNDYNSTTNRYPLLIFLHGKGEGGTDLSRIYNSTGAGGPAYFIGRGTFPTSFTNPADGKQYKFIIVSPQATNGWSTSSAELKFVIDYMVANYRVDMTRFYLAGISAGGQGVVEYAAHMGVTPTYKVAAMVPMSAAISQPTQTMGNTIAADNTRNWAFGSEMGNDIFGVHARMLNTVINTAKAGLSRFTDYPGGHCCWNNYFNPSYKESINGTSMNIYEWMLQFTNNTTTTPPPPVNNPPVANAGSAQTITLPANSVTLSGSGTDSDGTITTYNWTKTVGPAATITNASSASTTVTGMVAGTYTFRLTVTDDKGATSGATVQITVNAAPVTNVAPTANAGPDHTINLPQDSVVLTGSGTDVDGSIVKYEWNTVSGTSTAAQPHARPGGRSYIITPNAQGHLDLDANGKGYQPGDTLYLSGYFKSALIRNLRGSADNYITVTNRPGQTLIIGDSTWSGGAYSWGLVFKQSKYVQVGGTSKSNFKITGSKSTAVDANNFPVRASYFNLSIGDLSDNFVVHDITIRNGGTGVWAKTEVSTTDTRTWYPNTYLTNWEFYNLDIYGTYNEGMYIGHTGTYWNIQNNTPLYPQPGDPTPDPSIYKRPIKLTNVKIHDNFIHDVGNDGIQTAAIDGLEVYNNDVTKWALNQNTSHNGGLLIGGRVVGFNVHDNYVHDGWGELLQVFAEGGAPAKINNNLLVRNQQEGISMRGTNALLVECTNNTVAFSGLNSVRVNGHFGQTATNIFNKNLFINPRTLGGIISIGSYIYAENGARVQEGAAPNDNKKFASITGLLIDQLNFFLPDLSSPANNYGYKKGAGGGVHTIVNPNSPVTVVRGLTEGTYVFRLTVTDNNGATHSDEVTVVVRPPVPNKAPKASAGADKTITLPTNNSTLDGSGTDEDGTVNGYSWKKLTGPTNFTIANATNASTAVSNLQEGAYEFELTVTDDKGGTGKDTVKITVNPANKLPLVNAGIDIAITLPTNAVSLNGTATDDDGTISSTSWSKLSGPAQFTIANANNLSTDVTGLVAGVYEFVLQATDDKGGIGKDTIRVSVQVPANIVPTVNAGNDVTITLPTDYLTLTGTATDADGTINSTSWTKISGPSQFTIANAFSLSTLVDNLVAGDYEFVLTVNDNDGAQAKDTIKVSVIVPVNKAPVVTAGNDITITLPVNSASLTGTATDADGTISTTVWTKLAGPAGFTIGTPNALSTNITDLVAGAYDFVLAATDDKGAVGKDTVRIVVKDAAIPNVPPIADAGNDITITLPTSNTTLTGYMSDDPDGTIQQFSWSYVSGPSQYTIVNSNTMITALQNLVEGVYRFRLTVTDIDGATGTDEVTVTVRPTPNTPPASDAGADQTITLPTNSVTLDGSNSQDNDGTIANYSWTYVSGPSTYNIVSAGSATTAVNSLVAGVYTFMLTVTDDDGAKATNTVVVTVNKAPNVAPTASAGPDRTVTLPTNTVTLNGSGSDNDGTITRYNWTYVSGPTTYNIVSVGSATTVVNLLVEGVYKFRLTVTDNDNATASSEVTVTVNRRPNQAPAANAGGNRAITLPTNSITLNGSGTDNDGTISSYRWTYVSGPATYNIVSANSATTVVNSLVEGVYRFRLTVTDNDGATATSDVTVTVNAAIVNQPPTASAGPNQTIVLPTNSVTVNGAGMDNDGSIVGYQWTWLTGPTRYSITDPNSASTSITDLEEGTYTFRLTVTDDDGATATSHIAITVERAPNVSPVANAGVDFEVPRSAQIRLDGTGSYDPDGIIKEYFWSKVSGPSPSTMTDFETTSPVLWNPKPGTYVFSLTVTDDRGGTAIDYVTLVVVGSLTARAGADTTLSAPVDSYNLSGSALGGNGTISYKWERVEGAPDVTFSNGNIANPVVSNLKAGKYTFRLTVKDVDGEEATDEVMVDVKDDQVYHEAVIIYPNPVDATLNYKIFSDRKETVGISILDINGHVLKKVETQISAGVNMGTIDVSGLAPRAVYIFQTVYSGGQKKSTKFLKK